MNINNDKLLFREAVRSLYNSKKKSINPTPMRHAMLTKISFRNYSISKKMKKGSLENKQKGETPVWGSRLGVGDPGERVDRPRMGRFSS